MLLPEVPVPKIHRHHLGEHVARATTTPLAAPRAATAGMITDVACVLPKEKHATHATK